MLAVVAIVLVLLSLGILFAILNIGSLDSREEEKRD